MEIAITLLVASNLVFYFAAKGFMESRDEYKAKGLEFWKMYKDECEKNRWKGKIPGSKHEFGHDYE